MAIYHDKDGADPHLSEPRTWQRLGCFLDDAAKRTLKQPEEVPSGNATMTVEKCLGVCQSLEYTFAGLENGNECYCDHRIQKSGNCSSVQTECNMPCSGKKGQICGGRSRLSIYELGGDDRYSCNKTTNGTTTTSLFLR